MDPPNELMIQYFKLQLKMMVKWYDPRLDTSEYMNSGVIPFLPPEDQGKFWKPNFMFYDVYETKLVNNAMDHAWLEVAADPPEQGLIYYRFKMELKVACKMHMTYYPMDTQICTLDFRPCETPMIVTSD